MYEDSCDVEFLTGFGMIEDDPPSRFAATAYKSGLCHEFEGASRHAESVTPVQQRRRLKHHQIPATGCFGLEKMCLAFISSLYPCRNVAET